MERIPNEALVVRGGRNRPEDIRRSTGTHPSGITGISVECAVELSVAELAMTIPHAQVGVTIVVRCDRPMEMSSARMVEAKIMQP